MTAVRWVGWRADDSVVVSVAKLVGMMADVKVGKMVETWAAWSAKKTVGSWVVR